MVPVRKFSISTSARPARRLSTSTPSGVLRSSVMSRLLRLITRNAADSPSLCGGHVRDSSPLPVSSTLMTSAPRSDSSMAQNGPASTREQSTTRIPSRDSAGGVMVMRYYTSMTRLRAALGRRILVLDGAMGTMLQAAGLIAGGVDALLLETAQDTLNVKAAALGVQDALRAAGATLPLMVSGTIEPTGTMLAGQAVEALWTSLEHLDVFSIGLNCS